MKYFAIKIGIILFGLISSRNIMAQKQASSSYPIGVFDSGTGGLTVLEAMLTLDEFNNETGKLGKDGKLDFEKEYFQYLADQANMPYGNYAAENKTELLKEHILKNMTFLINNSFEESRKNLWTTMSKPQAKMLVLACNTATAYALNDIRQFLASDHKNIPTIGVIDAGVKAALQFQQQNEVGAIGVFATAGTVASDGYPRTLRLIAKAKGMAEPIIISQGGAGLAESIDRDWSYFVDTLKQYRKEYKGPSMLNGLYKIDTALFSAYQFNKTGNKLLCEFDDKGNCLDVQLNDPENYVRYHLVSLLEKSRSDKTSKPMNTLILGCTHYPFMRAIIHNVLDELYNYKKDGKYRYREVLAKEVALIDPSFETAKEAYLTMRKLKLENQFEAKKSNQFFITVPNTSLPDIKLQEDGWFTYDYKYGRTAGEQKSYINYVYFDQNNISEETYFRIKLALPNAYREINRSKSQ